MKLTKNFDSEEFDCKDGSEMPEEVLRKIKILAENLQVLRDYLGEAITINSGYRSPEYNKKINGAVKSQHLLGNAADIVVDNKTPQEVFEAIEELQDQGKMVIGGLHAYDTFTHYDIRGYSARW